MSCDSTETTVEPGSSQMAALCTVRGTWQKFNDLVYAVDEAFQVRSRLSVLVPPGDQWSKHWSDGSPGHSAWHLAEVQRPVVCS